MSYVVGLFLAALTLFLAHSSAHGTGQHMICKTVEDVFTEESNNDHQPSAGRRALQGPPGKRGQTGVKGEPGISGSKGQKGLPGFVNPENVESVIEMKLDAATVELQARIESLEQKVAELNSTRQSDTVALSCDDGFVHRGKCYYAKVRNRQVSTFEKGAGLCTRNNGKLANIVDREHQRLLENYLRGKIPGGQSIVEAWLALSYTSSTLHSSNGNAVNSLGWYQPGSYPSSELQRTNVAIVVNKNIMSSSENGLYNSSPTYTTNGALCEK